MAARGAGVSALDAGLTLADVLAARQRIAHHLAPTPLVRSETLSRALGTDLFLKLESLQPIGAFKVRGA